MATKDNNTANSPKKKEAQEKSTKNSISLAALMEDMQGEKKPKKRPYFYLQDFGLVIPYWGIISIEKTEEWGRINHNTQLVYGLVINRGIESSPNMPFGERKTIYEKQEIRDRKFDAIIQAMQEHNYEFSVI